MTLHIAISETKPGLRAVALTGRLDTETSPDLEARLEPVLAGKVAAIRFDLTSLQYMSSAGIGVLFKTFKALRQKDAVLLLANAQPRIKKVLEITRALPPETLFASVKEADDYYDAMQRKIGEADAR